MLKRLSYIDLFLALKDLIEGKTGVKVVDAIESNETAPFYYVEIVSKADDSTKTMWREVITIWFHAISGDQDSKEEIYDLIHKLEEALTVELPLPDDYDLLDQRQDGPFHIQRDETGEWHAVISYNFKICYGFKTKI